VRFDATGTSARVKLVSTVGTEVYSATVQTVRGSNELRLDVADLPAGRYLLLVDDGNSISVAPLNVVR
jgi:hypothetical protein